MIIFYKISATRGPPEPTNGQVGLRACAVAVLGTVMPLAAGTALTMAYQKPFFPMGVAAGTALAPTSVGIALRLLGEAGVLKEDFGQADGCCFVLVL